LILIGVGTDGDESVSAAVDLIRTVSNEELSELHHPIRLELEQISQFIDLSNEERITFVSHGAYNSLVDASEERHPYINEKDAAILDGCYVFSYACNSARSFGKAAVEHALVYLGFDTAISAPPNKYSSCHTDVRGLVLIIINFIKNITYTSTTDVKELCEQLLEDLSLTSRRIQENFDTDEGSLLAADDLITVRQFGNDLCAWVHGLPNALKAAGAPDRPFVW
jgi:hypothetical protein